MQLPRWLTSNRTLTVVSILGGFVVIMGAWQSRPSWADVWGVYNKGQLYSRVEIDGFRNARDQTIGDINLTLRTLQGTLSTVSAKLNFVCNNLAAVQIDNLTARLSAMRRDQLALERNSDQISQAIKGDLAAEIKANGDKLDLLRTRAINQGPECAT